MIERLPAWFSSTVATDSRPPLCSRPCSLLHLRGGSDSESNGGDSDDETEDPNDVAGYDGDDERSEEEVKYDSDYSYLDSDDSDSSSD